jgi:hypothetical protein
LYAIANVVLEIAKQNRKETMTDEDKRQEIHNLTRDIMRKCNELNEMFGRFNWPTPFELDCLCPNSIEREDIYLRFMQHPKRDAGIDLIFQFAALATKRSLLEDELGLI